MKLLTTAAAIGTGAAVFAATAKLADKDRDTGQLVRSEWSGWNGKLEQSFPERRLDTPADHARVDAFVKDNPPPKFVNVSHEGYTRIRTSIREREVGMGRANNASFLTLLGGSMALLGATMMPRTGAARYLAAGLTGAGIGGIVAAAVGVATSPFGVGSLVGEINNS